MTIYLGENLISGQTTLVGESRNIGQIIPSVIPLTDAGLHLLDGALIQGSGIYSAFVTYIAGLVSTYPDCFTTESNWQTAVTTYGVCGKFVYDSVNNTVRLPKITGIVEGTTDLTALGDLVEAGLPNITGRLAVLSDIGGLGADGAFTVEGGSPSSNGIDTAGGAGNQSYKLDASRSSSIYGNSTTVQPQTIKVLYYIVIATSTKTDIQVDIDEIAADLNGKADVDLTNVNDSGYIKMAKASMPSDTWDNLTVGASGTTYTAPADGWYYLNKQSTASSQYLSWIVDNGAYHGLVWSTAASQESAVLVPIKKGSSIIMYYSFGGTTYAFRFIYAVGSESEAS